MLETLPPPRFDYGAEVRVIRNLRNDGTHPGSDKGTLLVRRGATGIVRDVGTFLQDQVIYTVHFTMEDLIVGCRDKELIPADAPWVPNRFEFGDKVKAKVLLGIAGEVVASVGDGGEIIKVIRDDAIIETFGTVAYHVRFPGRTLQVPEMALDRAMAKELEPTA
ncbi:nitrogen fixation protein NifZ [Cohaesibacter marisflavi]|nr:nitrogen fixation protein NifZ [Cohaesibacter marisflavi]